MNQPTKTAVPAIKRAFNLCFGDRLDRSRAVRRAVQQQMRCEPQGKGNKAWKRYERMTRGEFHIAGNIYIA